MSFTQNGHILYDGELVQTGARHPLPIGSMQRKFRDSFSGTSLDEDKWESSVNGGSIAVGAGVLTLGSGTNANGESYVLSKEIFTIPFRISIGMTLSQRIANQTFLVEMISVDPVTLIPDGKHASALLFDGTTVTQAKYRVQTGGLTPLDSSASTFPTSASGGIYEIEPFADECWFHGGTLDATSARSNSYRRHQQIPDPNGIYKIRLRWLNGATPPATNTNAVIQFIAVQDYAELTAEITAGRGQSVAGQAMGVQVAGGTVTASGVTGNVAHDSAISGNPVRIGGRAVTTNYTAVGTGDVADFVTTLVGAQIVRPYSIPEGDWQVALSAITGTTDGVLQSATASIRNYLTALQFKNTSAVATEIVVKDGSTVIWRGHAGASMAQMETIVFPTPLKTTANQALNVACITTGTNTYVSAQGYKAP